MLSSDCQNFLFPLASLRIHKGANPPVGFCQISRRSKSSGTRRSLEIIETRRGRPFKMNIAMIPAMRPYAILNVTIVNIDQLLSFKDAVSD